MGHFHAGEIEVQRIQKRRIVAEDSVAPGAMRRSGGSRGSTASARRLSRHPLPGAFVLRDLEELSTDEVAELLGIASAAVRQRVHRARLMLRGYLSHLVGVTA